MLGAIKKTQSDHGNRLDAISAAQAEITAVQAEQGTKLDAILELLRRDQQRP